MLNVVHCPVGIPGSSPLKDMMSITKVVLREFSPLCRKRKGFLYRGRFIYMKEEHMSKELSKTYDPKDIEDRLYKKWEDNGYFHAEVDRSKKPFTIVMPPPNITGQLHMDMHWIIPCRIS